MDQITTSHSSECEELRSKNDFGRRQKPIPPPLNLSDCTLFHDDAFCSTSCSCLILESANALNSPSLSEKHLPIRKRRSSYSLSSPNILPSPSSLTNYVQKVPKSPFPGPFSPSANVRHELMTPPATSSGTSPQFSGVYIPFQSTPVHVSSDLSPPPSCTTKTEFEEFPSSFKPELSSDELPVQFKEEIQHDQWNGCVWLCFESGTKIRFLPNEVTGLDQPHLQGFTFSDELAQKEKVQNNGATIAPHGLKVLNMDGITGQSLGVSFLYLTPFLLPTLNIVAECRIDHPFYVGNKGWSSVCPDFTYERYGIACSLLEVGDVCICPSSLLEAVSPSGIWDRRINVSSNSSALPATFKEETEFVFPSLSQMNSDNVGVDVATPFVCDAPSENVKSALDNAASLRCSASPPVCSLPEDSSTVLPPDTQKKKKRPKDQDEKTRRPMNGFMIFAQRNRLDLIQRNPGKDNRSISVILGETWKNLSQTERSAYSEEAKLLATEHKRLYPDCWKRKRNSTAKS
ncbi:HMG box-containing protein 1-like [Artemia franciscana]|uniref:HMG box-containing protein 1 n=1 Tax=Artemia franciscana TaxID=6661 RepID=A0AA88HKU6_ARTSF|nr:hypothetical protein QYM36_014678 [Artemia franciscana]